MSSERRHGAEQPQETVADKENQSYGSVDISQQQSGQENEISRYVNEKLEKTGLSASKAKDSPKKTTEFALDSSHAAKDVFCTREDPDSVPESSIFTPPLSSNLRAHAGDNVKASTDSTPLPSSKSPTPVEPKPKPFSYAKAAVREHAPRKKGSALKKPARVVTPVKAAINPVEDDGWGPATPSTDNWCTAVNGWGPGASNPADNWDAPCVESNPTRASTADTRNITSGTRNRSKNTAIVTEGWGPQNVIVQSSDWLSPEQKSQASVRAVKAKPPVRAAASAPPPARSREPAKAWGSRDPAPHIAAVRARDTVDVPAKSERTQTLRTRKTHTTFPRTNQRKDWVELRSGKPPASKAKIASNADKDSWEATPIPGTDWASAPTPDNDWDAEVTPPAALNDKWSGEPSPGNGCTMESRTTMSDANPWNIAPEQLNAWATADDSSKIALEHEHEESGPLTRNSRNSRNSRSVSRPSSRSSAKNRSPSVLTSHSPSSSRFRKAIGRSRPSSVSPLVKSDQPLPVKASPSDANDFFIRSNSKPTALRADTTAFVPRVNAPSFTPRAAATPFVPHNEEASSPIDIYGWRRECSPTFGLPNGAFSGRDETQDATYGPGAYYNPGFTMPIAYPGYQSNAHPLRQQHYAYPGTDGSLVNPLLLAGANALRGLATYPSIAGPLAPIQLLPGAALYPQLLGDFLSGADVYARDGGLAPEPSASGIWSKPEAKTVRITAARQSSS